jgi:hypothetical protein
VEEEAVLELRVLGELGGDLPRELERESGDALAVAARLVVAELERRGAGSVPGRT